MPIDNIVLETIKTLPILTKSWRDQFYEGALVCFVLQGHKSGVKLKVDRRINIEERTIEDIYAVQWGGHFSKDLELSWGDPDEAVEKGATCIAILLTFKYTGLLPIQRSHKGTGFDYWLGNLDEVGELNYQIRLETSGIMKGKNRMTTRLHKRTKQTDKSDDTKLQAYIVVVEFSSPMCKFIEK